MSWTSMFNCHTICYPYLVVIIFCKKKTCGGVLFLSKTNKVCCIYNKSLVVLHKNKTPPQVFFTVCNKIKFLMVKRITVTELTHLDTL